MESKMCNTDTLDKLRALTAVLDELEQLYAQTKERDVELIANAITDMVLIVDNDGYIKYANPSTLRVLGYDPAILVGQNIGFIIGKNKKLSDMVNKTTEIVSLKKDEDSQATFMYVGEMKDLHFHLYIAVVRKVHE